ncbi:hypothetical protein AgCh_033933 [Apium graveolens]
MVQAPSPCKASQFLLQQRKDGAMPSFDQGKKVECVPYHIEICATLGSVPYRLGKCATLKSAILQLRLHPAMYLLALAYRTLDIENQKKRKQTRQYIGNISRILSWWKKLVRPSFDIEQGVEDVHQGPLNPSLLHLQHTHRSLDIWRLGGGDMLKCCRKNPNNEDDLPPLDLRMVPLLQSTGFYGVARVASLQLDWSLISALVER